MANIVTRWVLELADKMSAPVKSVQDKLDSTSTSWSKIGEAAADSMSDIQKFLNIEKRDLASYKSQLKSTEQTIKELKKQISSAGTGTEAWRKATAALEKAERSSEEYKKSIKETEKEIIRLNSAHDRLVDKKKKWDDLALKMNQSIELAQKLTSALAFGEEIAKTGNAIERMTGLTGTALTDLNKKSFLLAEQFGDDQKAIAQSANAMSKAMNISFTDALSMIENGYKKGANLNGDMLDQIREYSGQMHEAGISAGEMIGVMAQAGKEGIFSDKALDSLKEGNLSIREMGQAQVAALKGIGIEASSLAGKTTMEIMKMISSSMDGKSIQAQQRVIADVFRGAGEDAGSAWITGLGSIDMDVNNIPSVQEAGSSMRKWIGEAKFWFADTFSAISENAQSLGNIGTFLSGIIPLYQALASSQKLAAVAQWALNAAAYANPYVLIAAGIVALIAGTVLLVVKFKEVSGWIKRTWQEGGALTKILMVLAGVILLPLAPIYALAAGVRFIIDNFATLSQVVDLAIDSIMAFVLGDWKAAFESAKQAGKKVSGMFNKGQDEEMARHKPITIADRIAETMKMKNSSIVQQMKTAGKIHGSAYVDTKIKQAEKWAAYMDKMNKTDIYSKKVAAVKKEYFSGTDNQTKTTPLVNTGSQASNGLQVSGTAAGKGIIMNLRFDQTFNAVKGGADVAKIADEVAGMITDRLRDSLVMS